MKNRETIRLAQQNFPNEWRRIHRKVFRGADQYHSADIVYIHQLASLAGIRPKAESVTGVSLKAAAELQVQFHSPIFFVSQPFLDEVANTDLPDSIDWAALRLPYPAAAFVLPLQNGHKDPTQTFEIAVLEYSLHQHPSGRAELLLTLLDSNSLGYGVTFNDADGHSKQFTNTALQLLFTILFAMAARPEYVERGQKMGMHKKSASEIWSPNIVGRKFATKTDPNAETGTHASPRMHWRRGHFRYQVIGEGRSERKVIWIQRTLIMGLAKGWATRLIEK